MPYCYLCLSKFIGIHTVLRILKYFNDNFDLLTRSFDLPNLPFNTTLTRTRSTPEHVLGRRCRARAATPPAGNDHFPRVPPPKIQHFKAFPSRHVVGIIYHLSGLEGVISRVYICDDFKKVSKIRLLLLCLWLLGGRVQAAASCAIMKGNGSLH